MVWRAIYFILKLCSLLPKLQPWDTSPKPSNNNNDYDIEAATNSIKRSNS